MTTQHDITRNEPADHTGGREEALVSPEWLAAHLSDPDVSVVEVDVSRALYDEGHIEGALLWDVYRDLKDADYRLRGTAALETLLVRSGVGAETTVVFYGYAPAMGFWLARLLGHQNARVLDCSRETWRVDGHPWSSVISEPPTATRRPGPLDDDVRADQAQVRRAIGHAGTRLVDVRSVAEYDGDRFWPSGALDPTGRAGHIPTAVHQPIDGLYDERGAFLATPQLREVFAASDLDTDDDELITYCAVGGRAATAWFVLTQLLGRRRVRVYDGSWAEWGRTPDAPVSRRTGTATVP